MRHLRGRRDSCEPSRFKGPFRVSRSKEGQSHGLICSKWRCIQGSERCKDAIWTDPERSRQLTRIFVLDNGPLELILVILIPFADLKVRHVFYILTVGHCCFRHGRALQMTIAFEFQSDVWTTNTLVSTTTDHMRMLLKCSMLTGQGLLAPGT